MVAALIAVLLTAAPGGGPKGKPFVRVVFAGDVTLGYHYEEYVDEQVKKGKPKDEMLGWGFQQVKEVTKRADVFVVNLECPFTSRGEKITKNFNFRARPELVEALIEGGVDVVSLANNHLMDYGAEGLFDTQSTLEQHQIVHFGAGATLEKAREPRVIEKNGLRIAFVGYFFLGDRNIEPKEVIATDETPGVAGHHSDTAWLRERVQADVAAAKSKADLVIPFFHWGREGRGQPEPYQIDLAHAAIEAGAAAVIGSHPHVLQGIEVYNGAPIVYSLGNFVFGGNWDPRDKKTAMIELTLDLKGVRSTKIIPAYSDKYPEVPVQPYLAKGEEADKVLDHLAGLSRGFKATLPELAKRPRPIPDAGSPDAGQ